MRDPDANHDEDDPWLKDHREEYSQNSRKGGEQHRPSRKQRKRQRKRRKQAHKKNGPIYISDVIRECEHCSINLPKEFFKKGFCLGCQIENYLETH